MAAKISYRKEKWPFGVINTTCIFNYTEYLDCTLDDHSGLRKMAMLKDDVEIISLIYFIQNDQAIIGHRASFGYPEIVEGTSFEKVQTFMDALYQDIYNEKVKIIRWQHYPEIYNSYYNSIITQSLLNLGFVIEDSFINHHLHADEDFEKGLKEDTKRRLKKLSKSDFSTEVREEFNSSLFYDKIIKWREKKGFPISIESKVLDDLIERFDCKYVLFTMRSSGGIIASCLGIKVNEKTLYYFIPAHDPKFDEYSPAIGLIKSMHNYAKENNMDFLDLGTSRAKNEAENFGLIRFKEKLGAKTGIKFSLVKEIR
ncbi:GNAT family N-acetyltransferase [Hyphobacterium sp. CCMP332]|nr:GNAT family N-acetyltransferase [Hyphobacterium sp. CCMP332]